MSCDAAAAAAFLFLASTSPGLAPPKSPPTVSAPMSPVASEPLFADIVRRAGRLKADTEAYRNTLAKSPTPLALPRFDSFEAAIKDLSDLDMKGHLELAARGTDGDLKCILKGISQDLPRKLADLTAATTGAAQDEALRDMAYLLNDNVEVITAPPAPPV
jgi:hypothetical protein